MVSVRGAVGRGNHDGEFDAHEQGECEAPSPSPTHACMVEGAVTLLTNVTLCLHPYLRAHRVTHPPNVLQHRSTKSCSA